VKALVNLVLPAEREREREEIPSWTEEMAACGGVIGERGDWC
jgi:hypothetical protein